MQNHLKNSVNKPFFRFFHSFLTYGIGAAKDDFTVIFCIYLYIKV